jgi:hypothetical protein
MELGTQVKKKDEPETEKELLGYWTQYDGRYGGWI